MSPRAAYLRDDAVTLAVFGIAAATIGYVAFLWCLSGAAWLHPELLGTAAYIWNQPNTDTFGELLRKVFDWKAFDPNVNRVRPLNDLAEVIDAIARPYLTRLTGPQPSLTPVALLAAIATPVCFYAFLARALASRLQALMLCLLLLSCTGFLSVLVPYIRPAKKLNLLCLCVSLYYGRRHAETGSWKSFAAMYLSLLASFLSDELGLANFVICGVLFNRSLLRRADAARRAAFLSLPFVFLAITEWVLPALYARYGVHGAWNALADARKFGVFGFLLDPAFHAAAATMTARSVLSTFGIGTHTSWTEAAALLILVGAPLAKRMAMRRGQAVALLDDELLIATVLVIATSYYATLLDWYPFPYELSYLGSFNYYYHSSVVIPVLLWAAYALKSCRDSGAGWPARPLTRLAAGALLVLIVGANFMMFQHVNALAQIIHTYPYAPASLYGELRAKLPLVLNVARGEGGRIGFVTRPAALESRFERELHAVFGPRWRENGFFTTFESIKARPIMQPPYLGHLLRAYYPFHRFDILIAPVAGCDPAVRWYSLANDLAPAT